MKKSLAPRQEKILTIVLWMVTVLSALPLLHYGRRALVCDSFIVKGHSMGPTMAQGKRVRVNKLLMGPRIYRSFSFGPDDALDCFRIPGIRRLRVGDIAIFNSPRGWTDTCINFRINYVFAKRCVGIPGDSVSVVASRYVNSRSAETGVPATNEKKLASYPDSVLLAAGVLRAGHFAGMDDRWTIKDFGPLLVPARGMRIRMDGDNLALYKDVMEYETGRPCTEWKGRIYEFREDYYFFAGDNVLDSRDSRYMGFVPEKFVIGVVPL